MMTGTRPLALDDLPADRLETALMMVRLLRSGRPFFADHRTAEGLAMVDLLRAGRVEFVGEADAARIAVRLTDPRLPRGTTPDRKAR